MWRPFRRGGTTPLPSRTLAVMSRKGGSGKTTLAVHLAVAALESGRRVLIIDTDPQGSARDWHRSRQAGAPELVSCDPDGLASALDDARAFGTELVVVDCRPAADDGAAAIAGLADLVLIPSRPTILDLRATGATADMVRAARRPAALVLNAVQPPRDGEAAFQTADARDALAAYGIDVAPVTVGSRVVLAHALVGGLTATEFDPSGKAAAEIRALYGFVAGRLWPGAAA